MIVSGMVLVDKALKYAHDIHMIKNEKEPWKYRITHEEQLLARDKVFRRLGHVSIGDCIERIVYAAVVAELLKKTLPEVAEVIENLRDEKNSSKIMPVFIDGFRVGRVRHNLRKAWQGPDPFDYKTKDQLHTREPELALGLALGHLLNPSTGFADNQNSSAGQGDDVHPHRGYAVVVGQHGVAGVNTNIWSLGSESNNEPDFKAEIKRGSFLIIPPEFNHSVDGFEGGMKVTNKGDRNTFAFFVPKEPGKTIINDKELEVARKIYILPSREISK